MDMPAVVYRSDDRVFNLRLRVSLRKYFHASADELRDDAKRAKALPHSQEESIDIQWQEKIFGKSEHAKFAEMKTPATPLEKRYKVAADTQQAPSIIYTYVDQDDVSAILSRELEPMTTSPHDSASALAQHVAANVQKRGKGSFLSQLPFKLMCVCADVDGDGSAASTFSPVVLCVIKAFSDGRAEFRPAMTSQCNGAPPRPHVFVSPKGVCYEYEMSNLSAPKPLDPAQLAKRDRDLRRMQDRVVGMRRSLVGNMFEEVSQQQDLRLHVFGEFVEGWGFEHDNIYIRYCTQVPCLWTVAPGSVLESSSQISRALVQQQPIGAEDSSSQHVWRWSLPFSFSIGRNCATSHSSATLSDSPRIEVQVISYDSWDRARVLGMASITLSSASGVQEQVVQLWSPMGSVRDELAQEFIGGVPKLTPSIFAPFANSNTKALSMFGTSTKPSGFIKIRLNTLAQGPKPAAATAGIAADLAASMATSIASRPSGSSSRPAASHSRMSVADVTSRAVLLESARKQLSRSTAPAT